MQKCQLFVVQKNWREIQSGLEAIEVFLEVTIYVLHTVVNNFPKVRVNNKYCWSLYLKAVDKSSRSASS